MTRTTHPAGPAVAEMTIDAVEGVVKLGGGKNSFQKVCKGVILMADFSNIPHCRAIVLQGRQYRRAD